MQFRKLTSEADKEFRQWARDNYKHFTPIEGIWHPVIQHECVRMNFEGAVFTIDDEQEFRDRFDSGESLESLGFDLENPSKE